MFTTKVGGVSEVPYKSLNLGLHVNDKINNVLENRKRVSHLLNDNYENLVAAKQCHNDNIKVITTKDKGKGAVDYDSALDNIDGLITNQKDIVLTSYYADCTPIFLLDPVNEVVGLAHAGWKGTVKRIAPKTVLEMKEVYNTNPAEVLVGIGPAIGQCCYQVDSKVIKALADNFSNWNACVKEEMDDKWRLDLSKANELQLKEIGVRDDNIINSNLCTSCQSELFFSYRREGGETGRMASLIKLKNNGG